MRSFEFLADRYFVQPVKTRWRDPLLMHSHSWEKDKGFRFSPDTLIVRFFPLPFGLAFGRWTDSDVESLWDEWVENTEEAESSELYARYLALNDYITPEIFEERYAIVRGQVADYADDDPEIEMLLLQELGAM